MNHETSVAPAPTPRGPLDGVRIVEFAGIGPGPFAAMLLADMGADIVRIDRPGGVDTHSGRVLLRSRRTLVADLKDPASVADILVLLDQADALIEGFRPGVMERLGLGPDVVLARNTRLVYGRMTGWGQSGPLAQAAGHDLNYIAITGALAVIGPKSNPVPPLNLVGDFGGGSLYLVAGLLAGIIAARSTGAGQVVDCAICDGVASLMAMFTDFAARGLWQDEREANLLDGGRPYYRTFECADGRHVSVAALEPRFYATLRAVAGLEGAAFDRDGVTDWSELHRRLEAVFRTRTSDDWCALLEGTDACFAPVLTLSEAASHPHMAARQAFVSVDGVVQPAPAPRFSRTPSSIQPAEMLTPADALAAWAGPPASA